MTIGESREHRRLMEFAMASRCIHMPKKHVPRKISFIVIQEPGTFFDKDDAIVVLVVFRLHSFFSFPFFLFFFPLFFFLSFSGGLSAEIYPMRIGSDDYLSGTETDRINVMFRFNSFIPWVSDAASRRN